MQNNLHYQNAIITHTELGCLNDRGIMTFWIHLKWDGCGQGFGGYALDMYNKETKQREQSIYTADIIYGILNALELSSWEDLKGKYVRAIRTSDRLSGDVIGLAHIVKDKEFNIREYFSSKGI